MVKKIIFSMIGILLILIVFFYNQVYLSFKEIPWKPRCLDVPKERLDNTGGVTLELRLKSKEFTSKKPLEVEVILTNHTKNDLYFRRNWFSSESISLNIYGTDRLGLIPIPENLEMVEYFPPLIKEQFFLLKPGQKREYHQTFHLKYGIVLWGGIVPLFGRFLDDGKGVKAMLKSEKELYLQIFYYGYSSEQSIGKHNGFKAFGKILLSNQVNFAIK